jgi:RNA polymerase sigma-70 factor
VPASPDGAADPEVGLLKARYTAELKTALEAAIATLDPKQRRVIRMYFLEGLTADTIAKLYRVHETTAGRWIEQARRTILEETKKSLRERLGAEPELEGVMNLVETQFDVSFQRFLRTR